MGMITVIVSGDHDLLLPQKASHYMIDAMRAARVHNVAYKARTPNLNIRHRFRWDDLEVRLSRKHLCRDSSGSVDEDTPLVRHKVEVISLGKCSKIVSVAGHAGNSRVNRFTCFVFGQVCAASSLPRPSKWRLIIACRKGTRRSLTPTNGISCTRAELTHC